MHYTELNKELGNIDIYLLDQVLKGTFDGKNRILDAGCGEGRNMKYFVNNGYDVYGIDTDPLAIRMLHMMHKTTPRDNFLEGGIEQLPWKDKFFDSVICCAVLHFAPDKEAFYSMIQELSRVLVYKGVLFIRMASTMGMHKASSNSYNYLLTGEDILLMESEFGLKKMEPVKSVLVENERSMATLVLEKRKE